MKNIVAEIEKEWLEYLPPLTKQKDFDDFWNRTLQEAHFAPLNAKREIYDYPAKFAKIYDIEYEGFRNTPIHGWFILPAFEGIKYPMPCIVHFHGYTGNRGVPYDFFPWTMMGVAVISIDCRDQGGETGNSSPYQNGSMGHVYLRGILDENDYYVRTLYVDALRAIDFASMQPEVDKTKIILEGGSQGGGLAIAMAALDSRPIISMADVPSNSDMETRVLGAHGVYSAVTDYCKRYPERLERCLKTLSYFDTMNMADRIKCEIFASVGGKDTVCPPKCFYATYNRIKSPKQICIYPLNGHEGGDSYHMHLKMSFLKSKLGL